MLALALLLAVIPAQDTLRYQFELHQDQDIDMSAMGGGGMSQTLGVSGRFTLVTRDTTGGRVMAVRIDTATVTSSNPMLAGMMTIPNGAEMAWVVIDGKMTDLDSLSHDEGMGFALVGQAIAALGLTVPDSLAPGVTWSDTTTADDEMAAQGIQSTSVVHWRVADRVGQDVVLEGVDTTSISMEMEQASTGGTTTGTQRIVLRPDRFPREATAEQSGNLQMLMAGNPMTAKQRTRTSLLLLP